MGERTVDEVNMRWKRLAPGHYQLRIDGSTIVAVLERSALAPTWWWRTWNWETGAEWYGYERTLRAAKAAAIAARTPKRLKVV